MPKTGRRRRPFLRLRRTRRSVLLRQRIPGAAANSSKAKHELPAKIRDGTLHNGFAASANAKFLGHIDANACAGFAPHEMERLIYLAIGKNVDKGRLSELHSESLLQGIVKNGVAGFVVEVSQNDGVFFCERRSCGVGWGGSRAPVNSTGDKGNDNRCYWN